MNLTECDEELQVQLARLRRRQKLQRDEQQVLGQIAAAERRVTAQSVAIRDADRERKRLEGVGLGYLLGTLFGDRQDRIADAKQHLAKQQLQREECLAAVPSLQQDLADMRAEMADLATVEEQHAQLLETKEQLLQARGGDLAEQLFAVGERLAELVTLERELNEAVDAGKFVLAHLEASVVDLEGARSWGHADLFGNVFDSPFSSPVGNLMNGLTSGWAKHANLTEAQQHVHQAQLHMLRFVRELKDVQVSAPDAFDDLAEFGGALRLVDVLCDGLIVDWFVQSKIGAAMTRIEKADYQVRSIAHQLWKRGVDVTKQRETLQAERQALIEQAGP